MNFLEQLTAEWYEFNGHFVRTNIHYGKQKHGGYSGEIDVLAFEPKNKKLIHVETSTDAYSWEQRKKIFRKKFATAEKYYREIFPYEFNGPEKIAVVGATSPREQQDFGDGIILKTIIDLVTDINKELTKIRPLQEVVPERFPLLRAMQFSIFVQKRGKHR